MSTYKRYIGNITRPFVKHINGQSERTIEILRKPGITSPILSIIIPTIDATRDGYLPDLLKQLEQQTFQNYEIILIISDSRQGRAINCGVQVSMKLLAIKQLQTPSAIGSFILHIDWK